MLVGGHSVDDTELKYGLAVTGIVHPDKVLTNAGALAGDALILTKPLGTGVIATAVKGKVASAEAEAAAVAVMTALNRLPARCLEGFSVHAATDITGFGILGHALEMAQASRVEITFQASKAPLLPFAYNYAAMGLVPAGTHANRNFCAKSLSLADGLDPVFLDLLSDAQTNGGLLLAVPSGEAARFLDCLRGQGIAAAALVGEVTGSGPGRLRVEF